MKRFTIEEVEREIAALDGLELYKVEPPFKIRSGFLRRAIAYRLQELLFGGLSAKTRRQLRTIAEDARSRRQPAMVGAETPGAAPRSVTAPRRRILSPGTRLLREWNGSTEIVDVLVDGFGRLCGSGAAPRIHSTRAYCADPQGRSNCTAHGKPNDPRGSDTAAMEGSAHRRRGPTPALQSS